MKTKTPQFSIVIPAYNEAKRITKTINAILAYMKAQKMKAEIIVVDDGSSDNTTKVVSTNFQKNKTVKIITLTRNYGKGHAVKTGVLDASGDYILFTDADNSTPISELDKFLPILDEKSILIGSRYKKSEYVTIKKQPWYRIVISRMGNSFIRLFLSLHVSDTQCGFKLFPRDIAGYLFNLQTINRFGFDMEILTLAKLSNIKIIEIPVNWYDSTFSRFRPIKDAFHTFLELIGIIINLLVKRYKIRQF